MVITTARLIGTLVLTLGVVAFGEFVLDGPRVFEDAAQLVTGLAAAGLCLAAARRRTGVQRTWRLIAVGGLTLWSANRLWRVALDLADPARDIHHRVLDVGVLVLPACMLAGLLGAAGTRPRPVPTSLRRDQIALIIDSVLITGSVLALTWSVIPERLLGRIADWGSFAGWAIAYPVADLVLLTMVVLLLTTRPDSPAGRRPLRLIGAALVAFGTADAVRLTGAEPGWLQTAGYLLGPMFIALAALSPARPMPPPPDPAPQHRRDWFPLLMPYGPVLVSGIVLGVRTLAGHPPTSFQAYLGWLGLGLVVTRQMITILDNTALIRRVVETQRRLHHQAYHDPLTGLANRALFRERLVLALDAKQPVAVLFADLDDFKLINDTYGHAMGDRVLLAIGERLRSGVRPQDLVARLGGDEFAVVLDQTPAPVVPAPRRRPAFRPRRYVLSAAGIRISADAPLAPLRRRTDVPVPAPTPAPTPVSAAPSVAAAPPAVSGADLPAVLWEEEAETIGQRVLAALREPYLIDGRSVSVGVSIGLVAAEPDDGLSADLLLRRADAAMYAVKRRGKGALIRFTGPVHGPNADLPQLLAGALTGGSPAASGFEVYYQPIVRLTDQATVAVEALARWTDPVAGPVHPDVFVTMAERTGLVAAIDDFVLDQACADAHELERRFGRPIAVHVNVSAGRLGQDGLEAAVAAALARHSLPPSRLVVEITETLRISDMPRAAVVVARLREWGVRVALDDFGSGYNALAQLHGMPVDTVKLDSTLTDVDTAPERAGALCRSVLAICADLGITVVAEGIETTDRAAALAGLGCPLGQGYLFGPPVPLAKLTP
ncbi:EAL domain-containing protein [Actinoplanes sp. NPDC051851]|uniref:putative bifunctional diguanylate cyclase/phosphodiesterase n=1 Tax=Actinoplanes sp. NPDC051851 TaxID=3154753 RepID=UPI003431F6D2